MIHLVYGIADRERLERAYDQLLTLDKVVGIGPWPEYLALEVLQHLDALALEWGRGLMLEEVGLELRECWVEGVVA